MPLNPKEKFRQFVEDLMNEESDDEEEVGPVIPEDHFQNLQEKEEAAAAKDQNLLTTSYRRPRRFKQNPAEQLHPLDEKRLLGEVKLKEHQKRETEIQKFMGNLINKDKV